MTLGIKEYPINHTITLIVWQEVRKTQHLPVKDHYKDQPLMDE